MTTKHTPGPWVACQPGDYADFDGRSIVILGDNMRIAVVQGDDETALANARLIEAAPAMLAALRAILFQVVQGKVLERDACITAARKALAEAAGEQA